MQLERSFKHSNSHSSSRIILSGVRLGVLSCALLSSVYGFALSAPTAVLFEEVRIRASTQIPEIYCRNNTSANAAEIRRCVDLSRNECSTVFSRAVQYCVDQEQSKYRTQSRMDDTDIALSSDEFSTCTLRESFKAFDLRIKKISSCAGLKQKLKIFFKLVPVKQK